MRFLPRRFALRAVVGLSLSACRPSGGGSDPAKQAPRAVPVVAATVAKRDVPIYLEGLGNVVAYQTVTVHTQVDGRLDKVLFREGQAVKKGEVIAQVDPRPFVIQQHQAEGALARDRATLEDGLLTLRRDKELLKRQLTMQQQVDDQEAAVAQAKGAIEIDQAQIEAARLQQDYARITSPIDGVTGIRQVDQGNLVHAADPGGIVVITQIDPIAVLFTLPEDDLVRVAAELRKAPLAVEAWSRDGGQRLGTGKLALIDNQINQATATLKLKALFDNPERALWPNQFVKVRLHLTTRQGALVIPAAVVQRGPQGTFAYVIDDKDVVQPRSIEIEMLMGDLAIVANGLAAGERVVADGQNLIRPGSHVSVRSASAGEVKLGEAR
ncbi:MAG: efflux RND transporter periplasmic adaptor subunit [Myxococcales bacterium]